MPANLEQHLDMLSLIHKRIDQGWGWKQIAAEIYEVPVEQVTTVQRSVVKRMGFAYMYSNKGNYKNDR